MADFQALLSGLRARLGTISGLRVLDWIPDTVPVPCAFIDGPATAKRMAMGSTKRDWRIKVRVLTSRADDRVGQSKLNDYLDIGTTSIDDAIDGDKTLGGVADFAMTVDSATNYGIYEAQGIKFWGFEVLIRIVA